MKEPLWTRDFFMLIFSNAFTVCSFQLLFPTLPLFLAEYGNDTKEIGTIMGIFTFSAILIRPFSASFSRKWGKKTTLFLGFVVSLLAIFTYRYGESYGSALAIRLVHGLGFGITSTLLASILSDLVPNSRRGEGIGYLGFGVAVISSAAPFIGLWIYDRWHADSLFLASGLTLVISVALSIWINRARLVEPPAGAKSGRRGFGAVFQRRIMLPAALTLLLGICYGSVMSFMALFGTEHRIANVGWFFFASTAGSFVARLVSGRVFDRRGPGFVVVPGTLLGMAGLVLLSQSYSVVPLVLSALLYGLGSGTLLPAFQAWILNTVEPAHRTDASALFYNAFDVGIGGGSVLLGYLAYATSYSFVYLCSAFIMLALLVTFGISRLSARNKRGSAELHG